MLYSQRKKGLSMNFSQNYGPWSLVAGASEGVGKEFAESLASKGLNVVLLARRRLVLEEVASEIEQRYGIETRILTIDLTSKDAAAKILEGISDLQIGFFVYCPGLDPDYRHFLDNSLEAAESMVHRNSIVPMQLCYYLGGPMAELGRGAIVIVGSGAGFAGSANMAAYAASKSFDMIFTEALWCELQPKGVDVLGLILGETDTPALSRLRERRGLKPVKGADSPQKVVEDALVHLTKGPTRFPNKKVRWGFRLMALFPRKRIVMIMSRAAAKAMGP